MDTTLSLILGLTVILLPAGMAVAATPRVRRHEQVLKALLHRNQCRVMRSHSRLTDSLNRPYHPR
ncbi:MAG: hypothetical protein WCZ23_10420 [Rhodospirillaceae bacterium]